MPLDLVSGALGRGRLVALGPAASPQGASRPGGRRHRLTIVGRLRRLGITARPFASGGVTPVAPQWSMAGRRCSDEASGEACRRRCRGGNQYNMEVFGKHNPHGTIVAAGSMGTPSIVEFMPGDILNIPVTNTGGGNQGIFITSVEISGVDASLFNVINGPVESHFIQNGDSMDIQVEFTGTAAGASAEIIILYVADQSIVIPFSSIQS